MNLHTIRPVRVLVLLAVVGTATWVMPLHSEMIDRPAPSLFQTELRLHLSQQSP